MKIKLRGVTKEYFAKTASVKALDNVDLEFENVGLVLITGENGCGKSTLLNIIGGLDRPTYGEVFIDEKNQKNTLRERAKNTSYIFQTSNLIDTLTVRQNISLVADKDEDIDKIIKKTGLEGLESRFPHELSIGQQQRVCIARAIGKNDRILLADEPTSSLDPEKRKEIADLLTEISKEKLVIVVTHYPEDFSSVDRHIVMSKGKIISDELLGEKRSCLKDIEVKKPANKFSAILNSSFTRMRRHVFRFVINFVMLFIGLVCIVVNESVFSYGNDNNTTYRQLQAYDEVLVTSDDYSALEGDVKPIFRYYYWYDFDEIVQDQEYEDLQNIDSDYYKACLLYDPYFMDVSAIGDRKLIAGRMPQKQDEIVINKFLADMYIEYYAKEKLNSYQDVVDKAVLTGFDYGLSVQDNPVFRVVGITDDDLSDFEALKSSDTDIGDLGSSSWDIPEDKAVILYKEFIEWLNLGNGAIYAIDYGVVEKSVNGYFNGEISWADEKENLYAKQGSDVINLDYEGAYWLEDVEIIGTTDGAVVNFDKLSDISYEELCEKYDSSEEVLREVEYVLEKYKGKELYFSMLYMNVKKHDSPMDEIYDPFSKSYYFDFTLPITGVYIPEDEYFGLGGVFSQSKETSVRDGVMLLNEENYNAINTLYNTLPDCGLALLDVSGIKTEEEAKAKLDDNIHIREYHFIGEYDLSIYSDRISLLNVVALSVGAFMLLSSLIFVLYSLSQYFKQYSGDIGILMSLGKGKAYCSVFMLGEYIFMVALSILLTIPALFAAPAVLNSLVSGIAIKLNVFLPSVIAFLYVIAYLALLSCLSLLGVIIGLTRKAPIERIRDRL